jgi:hypothetical protein
MKAHYCSICNKSTYDVDYDYLVGFDHLACHLGVWGGDGAMKKIKNMKIKGWEKISGFTYKGYTCVNPIHNAQQTIYYADVLNLNLPQKPKWHLELHIDKDSNKSHSLILLGEGGINVTQPIELVDIRTLTLFRIRYEEIIDEMLSRQLTASTLISSVTPNSHSINSSGIISTINNNANTFTLNTPTTSINIMDTIKDLYKQIDELKQSQSAPDF